MSVREIIRSIENLGYHLVEITGGEPLLQDDVFLLTQTLLDQGYEVLIETSGAHTIDKIDRRAKIILDIKCPGSGMMENMHWPNIGHIKKHDEIKFVIADQTDFQWASSVVHQWSLAEKCPVLFSPVHGKLEPQELVQWILKDLLPVRIQLQIHKYIWHPGTKKV